jgi:hypothetical protein
MQQLNPCEMNEIILEEDGKKTRYEVPGEINQLTAAQWEAVVVNYILPPSVSLVHVFSLFCAMLNKTYKEAAPIFHAINQENLFNEVSQSMLHWLTQTWNLRNWLMAPIRVAGIELYGPAHQFSYMRFGEFISLDIMYLHYIELQQAPEPERYTGSDLLLRRKHITSVMEYLEAQKTALNRLCAAIMRPQAEGYKPGSSADRREAFSSELIDMRAHAFASADPATKLAIMYNYAGIREYIVKKYPRAFISDAPDTPREPATAAEAARGWLSIRQHIAGNLLNLQKVDELYLSDVLNHMSQPKPQQ